MSEAPERRRVARFAAGFEVNLTTQEIRKYGIRLTLEDQPFQILVLLLVRSGILVTRDEIRRRLWPSVSLVNFDYGLNTALSRLHETLEDSAGSPRYIETVASQGYRWMTPVDWTSSNPVELPETVFGNVPNEVATPDSLIGRIVSHYRVLELVGAGGMGVVYKAEDIKLGRWVALKFLPQELVGSPEARDRFEREARAASALNHPHICTIYEVEEHERQPFIVMELLEGQTLRDRIAGTNTALPTSEVVDLSIQIVDGLDAAHQKGIIHRDIKTANIFLTKRGEAKILDFGLAKIVKRDNDLQNRPEQEGDKVFLQGDPTTLGSFPSTLTRFGALIGTVSCMSPEQVRGEKLDSRTDLFSFGLVLYEIATGQRAFWGNTTMQVNDAILHRTPPPARHWNSSLPVSLEFIIDKALQKDRESRYQYASEMRADLKRVKWEMESGARSSDGSTLAELTPFKEFRNSETDLGVRAGSVSPGTRGSESRALSKRLWLGAIGALALVLCASAVIAFFEMRRPTSVDPKLRRLTANSSEMQVSGGAISPDGKYVAFTEEMRRMRVKIIATDETLTIPEPESLKGSSVAWEIAAWFPDGTRFLANARGLDDFRSGARGSSIWIIPLGGVPRKLRDDAEVFSVSPDGTQIAFGANWVDRKGLDGDQEIWLMDPSGQQARKLYDADAETVLGGLDWMPDGHRTIYGQFAKSGAAILSRDLEGGPVITVLSIENQEIGDFVWLRDGRLIYSLSEPEDSGSDNFWELRVDLRTGKPDAKPRRLTNWDGFKVFGPSATANGKRIAFIKQTIQASVQLADLKAGGTRIDSIRHLTLSEYDNEAQCWTPDGKSLIFQSQRNGHGRLFKQALSSDTEEPFFAGAGDITMDGCSVSPDGSWLFYNVIPLRLMKIPIDGGTPQLVLTFLRSDTPFGRWMPRCAVSPSKLCVIAEQSKDGEPIIFTSFDATGRGQEITRFQTEPGAGYNWALSPDGAHIAILKADSGDARIHILSLNGQPPRTITVKGWSNLQRLFWAADGKGWFLAGDKRANWVPLYVNPQGNADVLWESKGNRLAYGLPSPDGRHLAIETFSVNRNLWVMENF